MVHKNKIPCPTLIFLFGRLRWKSLHHWILTMKKCVELQTLGLFTYCISTMGFSKIQRKIQMNISKTALLGPLSIHTFKHTPCFLLSSWNNISNLQSLFHGLGADSKCEVEFVGYLFI